MAWLEAAEPDSDEVDGALDLLDEEDEEDEEAAEGVAAEAAATEGPTPLSREERAFLAKRRGWERLEPAPSLALTPRPYQSEALAAWREAGGRGRTVLFEAVGVPGTLQGVIDVAPPRSQIIVVGVCMQPDSITPFFGIAKEMRIGFALGYDPMEFAQSLRSIADGDIDVAPMITGEVDLDGVAGAFDALADPEVHAKILIDPKSAVGAP
jgi:threonine dehydrogenase-like Zn-dependent dehydrogenase